MKREKSRQINIRDFRAINHLTLPFDEFFSLIFLISSCVLVISKCAIKKE